MDAVQRFPINTNGRDFVVGDIHGCFDALCDEMDRVSFDPACDRMFSVGDLVDRGAQSLDATDWIAQPWFHAVRGNHEQMAIGVAAGRHDPANYARNGGLWFLALDGPVQARIAAAFNELPVCIEVETAEGLVGLVHADIEGDDWAAFTEQLASPRSHNHLRQLMEAALWSRDRISAKRIAEVSGVAYMYVGHTPVQQPVALGNVCYVDTGAVFGRGLTVMELSAGLAREEVGAAA